MYTISLSFHGNYLFCSSDPFFRVWDTASGKILQEVEDPSWSVSAAAFLPNDEFLVLGDWRGTMRIWKWKTWVMQHSLDVTVYRGSIRSIVPSQDGRLIACLVENSEIHEIQVWDAEKAKRLWSVQFPRLIGKIYFSADSSYIATDRGHQIPVDQYAAAPASELNMPVQRWNFQDDWLCRNQQSGKVGRQASPVHLAR